MVGNIETNALTAATLARITQHFVFQSISTNDPAIEYCLALAKENMKPYLHSRGRNFDDTRWRLNAPMASFFTINKDALSYHPTRIGFLAVRREPDSPNTLHVGDIQVEAAHRNVGAGTAAIHHAESLAHGDELTEITLNVFRENPAIALYERLGFRTIDYGFDKYKMRKILQNLSAYPTQLSP